MNKPTITTLSRKTVIQWKWTWRLGRVNYTVTRPSDGKIFKRSYVDNIYLLWAPNRQQHLVKVTDRWIYFTVNKKRYRVPL